MRELDQALERFADICARSLGSTIAMRPARAPRAAWASRPRHSLDARFRPGVDIVAELGGLAQAVEGATLVFTGEGRMDAQTLRGKTPAGVARIARQAGVPVVALAGSLGEGYEVPARLRHQRGVQLAPGPITLQQALNDAERLLHDRARDVMRLWMAAQKRML